MIDPAPRLEPIVDRHRPLWTRRVAVTTALAVGLGAVAARIAAGPRGRPALPPAPVLIRVPPPALAASAPMSVAITLVTPPAAPAAPATPAGCPTIARPDVAIGAAVEVTRPLDPPLEDERPAVIVVAAARAPQLAILHDGQVWVSDDDGRRFRRAFADHVVAHVAIAADGTVYAQDGDQLGVRRPDGRARWRAVAAAACADGGCVDRIAVVDARLVWLHDEVVAISRDRGQTWRVDPDAAAWSRQDGPLVAWRGALFQVDRYVDMCGIDDDEVHRLDRAGAIDRVTFHRYYTPDEPVLRASSDVDTAWSWTERCWTEEPDGLGRCRTRDRTRRALLVAQTLRPVEGARALALWGGALVELCGDGAHQIYRSFPLDRIDAVDAAGRPLVVQGGAVLRWSPVHGWRRLFQVPAPVTSAD